MQAQILNLLRRLQAEMNLTLLLISHDLSVVRHMADRIAVMYLGRIVEMASTGALFTKPRHPYTQALLQAIPQPDPMRRTTQKRPLLEGEPPSPLDPPSGCAFHPRCPWATQACRQQRPALEKVMSGHRAACLRLDEITQNLQG